MIDVYSLYGGAEMGKDIDDLIFGDAEALPSDR